MFGGDLGGDVRFHVDSGRASLIVEPKLFGGVINNRIRTNDMRVHRVGKNIEESWSPGAVGCDYVVTTAHARCDDPVTRREFRRQAAGDSKADDARRAAPDCCAK